MPDIEQYKVRISGCRANCFDEQTIKTALAKKFGTPSAHVSQLLAGKTATINKKFQLDEANKIVCFLEQLGLVAGVESTVSKPCHQKLDHDALTAALKKAEPSVPRNWKYMGCSLVVSCAVVSLFAVYIALIGALFAFSVIHTVNHVTLSGSYDQILLENMLYMVPGGIALLLVLALLKPLIARRPGAEKLLRVFRQDEPVLFNFLSQIAAKVGAKPPSEVFLSNQVNASAGLKSVFSKKLTLNIGLPLIAGLRTDQLAGVIAHEFGHFSQSFTMRLTWITRRILTWFEESISAQDSWDEHLAKIAQHNNFVSTCFVHLADFFAAIGRGILKVLFYIGDAIAKFLMRQMELDADRYEAALVGSKIFRETVDELILLSRAFTQTEHQLMHTWQDGKLVKNMPDLVALNRTRFSADTCEEICFDHLHLKTHWSDSHPDYQSRIDNISRLKSSSLFKFPVPAKGLLSFYEKYCVNTSLAFYRTEFDLRVNRSQLIDNAAFVDQVDDRERGREALNELTNGFDDITSLAFRFRNTLAIQSVKHYRAITEKYTFLTDQLSIAAIDSRISDADWDDLAESLHLEALLDSNIEINKRKYSYNGESLHQIKLIRAHKEQHLEKCMKKHREIADTIWTRAFLAKQIVSHEGCILRNKQQLNRELQQYIETLTVFEPNRLSLVALWKQQQQLEALLSYISDIDLNHASKNTAKETKRYASTIYNNWIEFRKNYARMTYPFDHLGSILNIKDYIESGFPDEEELKNNPFALSFAMNQSLDRFRYLWYRVAGLLAYRTLEIESIFSNNRDHADYHSDQDYVTEH